MPVVDSTTAPFIFRGNPQDIFNMVYNELISNAKVIKIEDCPETNAGEQDYYIHQFACSKLQNDGDAAAFRSQEFFGFTGFSIHTGIGTLTMISRQINGAGNSCSVLSTDLLQIMDFESFQKYSFNEFFLDKFKSPYGIISVNNFQEYAERIKRNIQSLQHVPTEITGMGFGRL